MKVKELIKKLQSFDEDAEVLLSADEPSLDREVNGAELTTVTFNSYFNKQDDLIKEVELYGSKKKPILWRQ
jgi:hypothetical protein